MKRTPVVFLDANVYFAAARSPHGGSAIICDLIKNKRLQAIATSLVLYEADRNIRRKEPLAVRVRFYQLLTQINPRLISVNQNRAETLYGNIINRKDTHVLYAAAKAKVNYLVTLDKKHFTTRKLKTAKLPLTIVSPGKLIELLAIS